MDNQLIYITLAVVLSLAFQPLRRVFEKATDRIFFRDRYDTQTVLNRLGQILTSERLSERLLDACLVEICQNLRIVRGQFIVLEKDADNHVTLFGPTFDEEPAIEMLIGLGDKLIASSGLTWDDPRQKIMDTHKIQVSVPLKIHDRVIGFLVLGDKSSGSTYSRQDLGLLQVAAPEVAVAVSNAQGYEQILRFNNRLQREVRQATRSLRIANQNLKALDKAKDEFISVASHQLRTPLAIIEACLSMLARANNVGDMARQQQHFLESASAATQRMAETVSEMVDVSALTTGSFITEKKSVDLEALVVAEVNNLQAIAKGKGLELTYQGPGHKLPPIQLDEIKTRHIIMNLIDNAIHYTFGGGIKVVLKATDDMARLTVTDSGIGVPAAEQSKLFDKFFRASNARKERPDGSGLGLYLAQQVVIAEGGKMIFNSQEGQGSTFGFEVPIIAADETPAHTKDHKAHTPATAAPTR